MRFPVAILLILSAISCKEKTHRPAGLVVRDTMTKRQMTNKEKMNVVSSKFETDVSFVDFHVAEIDIDKAELDFTSNKDTYRFRTIIREAYQADTANFAGHYTLVWWGCGSPCQDGVIIDRTSGKIYDVPAASLGYDFRANSRMLIVNPPDPAGFYDNNSAFGKPAIFALDEETKEFIEILEVK